MRYLAVLGLLGLLWGCSGFYAGGVGQGLRQGYGYPYVSGPQNCTFYRVTRDQWQQWCY